MQKVEAATIGEVVTGTSRFEMARVCRALAAVVFLTGCGGGAVAGPAAETTPAPVASDVEASAADAADDEAWLEWDDDASTLDGVYTAGQAERGAQVFENVCSNCHEVVDWEDQRFQDRWNGESIYRFFFYIWERMPNGEPPYSLPRQDVTDVITYILQENGLPAGERELGSDDDSLSAFWLYWSEDARGAETSTH